MNTLSPEEISKLRDAFDRGLGVREAARVLGFNRETVGRYYREWRPVVEEAQPEAKTYIVKRMRISTGQEWTEKMVFDDLRDAIGRAWSAPAFGGDFKSSVIDSDGKFVASMDHRPRSDWKNIT